MAYEAGASGKGVKIAIIDTGLNGSLNEFAGRVDPASGDVYGTRGVSDDDGHGTAVTAVAAAARNGSNTMGVAFEATIVSLRADQPGSCSGKDGCAFYDDAIAAGIDKARMAGAKVINLSLGGSTPSQTLLAAMQRAVNAGIVLVIAAGNDGTANPDPFALSPAKNFPGMVIIAGSIGVDNGSGGTDLNTISTFSNRAGAGAQWYLAALGFDVRAPDNNGKQWYWSGTSFSAPTIAGAVALLAHAFPNLTGAEIVEILFMSADDLGAAGVDSIFGHGRLNLASAFQPIGTTSFADSKIEVSTTDNGDLPPAAGDANTGQSVGAIILDGYSRAYVLNLARTLQQAEVSRPLKHALRGGVRVNTVAAGPLTVAMTIAERRDLPQGFALERLGIGPEDARRSRLIAATAVAKLDDKTAAAFGFSEGAKAMERRLSEVDSSAFLVARDIDADPGFTARRDASFAVRRRVGAFGATVSGETGSVWNEVHNSASDSPYRWTGISVDRRFGRTSLTAGLSRLEEKRTLLGGRMSSALGGGGSSSLFLDVAARHRFGGGVSGVLSARRGWTDFATGSFVSDAYAFDLSKAGVFGDSDRVGLRVSQPLRIANGGFGMMLPTAYDWQTGIATSSWQTMSLSPSGRELDAELSYGSILWDGKGWIGGNLFVRRQPGHVSNADDDYGAAIRLSLGL